MSSVPGPVLGSGETKTDRPKDKSQPRRLRRYPWPPNKEWTHRERNSPGRRQEGGTKWEHVKGMTHTSITVSLLRVVPWVALPCWTTAPTAKRHHLLIVPHTTAGEASFLSRAGFSSFQNLNSSPLLLPKSPSGREYLKDSPKIKPSRKKKVGRGCFISFGLVACFIFLGHAISYLRIAAQWFLHQRQRHDSSGGRKTNQD